jgi:hypothetical protein
MAPSSRWRSPPPPFTRFQTWSPWPGSTTHRYNYLKTCYGSCSRWDSRGSEQGYAGHPAATAHRWPPRAAKHRSGEPGRRDPRGPARTAGAGPDILKVRPNMVRATTRVPRVTHVHAPRQVVVHAPTLAGARDVLCRAFAHNTNASCCLLPGACPAGAPAQCHDLCRLASHGLWGHVMLLYWPGQFYPYCIRDSPYEPSMGA